MAMNRPRARSDGRARILRFLLLAVVVIGLAPGTFLRTDTGLRSDPIGPIAIDPVDLGAPPPGLLRLTGSWKMTSDHGWFGGFSSLMAGPDRTLIAGTDRGFLLDIDLADSTPRAVRDSFRFAGVSGRGRKEYIDMEAVTSDPSTGTLWASFENDNLVIRFAADGTRTIVAPPAMADWRASSGPETMVRLSDGRFLILAEGSEKSGMVDRPALLFPGDPVTGAAPVAFRFNCRAAYAPVDAALLPDGRLLILMRHVEYRLPAKFDAAMMIADPATIRAGGHWRGEIIQYLGGDGFGENFEGIAYVPDKADPAKGSVWVVADDNFSIFQRTLLLRFAWEGSGAAMLDRAAKQGRLDYERALGGAKSPLVICPRIDARGKPLH